MQKKNVENMARHMQKNVENMQNCLKELKKFMILFRKNLLGDITLYMCWCVFNFEFIDFESTLT